MGHTRFDSGCRIN